MWDWAQKQVAGISTVGAGFLVETRKLSPSLPTTHYMFCFSCTGQAVSTAMGTMNCGSRKLYWVRRAAHLAQVFYLQ